MISTTPVLRDGSFQLNLIEFKNKMGLTTQFHFEVINIKTGRRLGIYDRLTEGRAAVERLANDRIGKKNPKQFNY